MIFFSDSLQINSLQGGSFTNLQLSYNPTRTLHSTVKEMLSRCYVEVCLQISTQEPLMSSSING